MITELRLFVLSMEGGLFISKEIGYNDYDKTVHIHSIL